MTSAWALFLAVFVVCAQGINITHFANDWNLRRDAMTRSEFVVELGMPWSWADIAAFVQNLDQYTADVTNATGVASGGCRLNSVTQGTLNTFFTLSCLFDDSATTAAQRSQFVDAIVNHGVQTAANVPRLIDTNVVFHVHGSRNAVGYWHIDRVDTRANARNNQYHYYATGEGVRIYVIDTGVYGEHSEFAPLGRAQTIANTVDGSGLTDCHGHGTHVASLAAGVTTGVASAAFVRAIKALDCAGSGTAYSVVSALLVVEEECLADPTDGIVINFSINGPASTMVDQMIQRLLNECAVAITVAAGNSQTDACTTSPARVAGVLTFAATDINDGWAWFNNYGSCVALRSPGVDITAALNAPSGNRTMSGTSMAAPLGAGACALVFEQLRVNGWAPNQANGAHVMNVIRAQATPSASSKPLLFTYFYVNASNNYGLNAVITSSPLPSSPSPSTPTTPPTVPPTSPPTAPPPSPSIVPILAATAQSVHISTVAYVCIVWSLLLSLIA